MEKIRLKNGQEFNLVPMGISEQNKTRSFKITTTLTYEEIKAVFSDPENISNIDYILSDDIPYRTYADCVSFKGMAFETGVLVDGNTEADVYTVILSIDPVELAMKKMQENILYTELALTEIYEMVLGGTL